MAKVSIVIPIYNAEKYLRQCLDSIVCQTLSDIEIICVNDGSADSSPDIIQEYACRDSRIKMIDKENSGYGCSMNMGIDAASGEYIGIVESDDYADSDMFERLYTAAVKDSLDLVKGGFYYYYSAPRERSIPAPVLTRGMPRGVFCPTESLSLKKKIAVFNIKPTIWSAIYKTDFIKGKQIRFNETPGASYQDLAFTFKAFSEAKRVKLIRGCFLHYRQDNESSSINSPGKVYCVCDEYREIERFISGHDKKQELEVIKSRLKYDTYVWNYERLTEPLAKEFIIHASADLEKDMENGFCDKSTYPWYKWDSLNEIISDPDGYHNRRQESKNGIAPLDSGKKRSLGSRLRGAYRCLCENGFSYTFKRLLKKVKDKLFK